MKYGIVKHHKEFHQGHKPRFRYELNKGHASAIERQLIEALMIQHEPRYILMNSRSEWGYNYLPQQVTTRKDDLDPRVGIKSTTTHHQANKDPDTLQPLNGSNEAVPDHSYPIPQTPVSHNTNMSTKEAFDNQFNQRRKRARKEKEQQQMDCVKNNDQGRLPVNPKQSEWKSKAYKIGSRSVAPQVGPKLSRSQSRKAKDPRAGSSNSLDIRRYFSNKGLVKANNLSSAEESMDMIAKKRKADD